ncbi:MAG: glycerophosphoryl diester phosphodiesterase membrane domain-containing protein [Candidatus Dormibacter sp.]
MATAGTPVRLRPMPLGELLDETFKLYRRHFSVIAGVALAVILPGLIVTLVSGSYRANPFTYLQQIAQNANDPAALQRIQSQQQQFSSSPLYLLSFPITLLLLPFSVGAVYYAATAFAAGSVETIGSVLIGTLRRYFGLFGVLIIALLVGVTAALIITIPVVIWIEVRWAVAFPALLAERVGPTRALGRSWALVKGNWWRTLGILIVVSILVSIIQAALGALLGGMAALMPGLTTDFRAGLVTVVTALVSAIVGAISPIAMTMLYLDLRVRKEGVDLDQLARQTTPGAAPA